MINRRSTFAGLVLLAASGQLFAQDLIESHNYFFEAGGTHINSGSSDIDGIYGAFTFYVQEVSHGQRPHTQAAYLEEASSITFAIGDLVGDYPYFGKKDGEMEVLDVQFTSSEHWVFGGTYSKLKIDELYDQSTRELTFGRYFSEGSRLLFTAGDMKTESIAGTEQRANTYGLEIKNVNVRVDATALTLEAKYRHIDADAGPDDQISLQGEYHFNLATSVTAQFDHYWGSSAGSQYTLSFNQFFTKFFSVGAKYSLTESDRGDDTKTITAYARLIF